MIQTMLRQLLWIFVISILKFSSCYEQEDELYFFINPQLKPCDTEQCMAIDDLLANNTDYAYLPCDDYYSHTCKNDTTTALHIANYRFDQKPQIISDIETILKHPPVNPTRALKREIEIYEKCSRENRPGNNFVNKDTYETFFKQRGAYHFYPRNREQNLNWYEIDTEYAKEGLGFTYFKFEIVNMTDINTGTKIPRIQISPPENNALPIRDFFLKIFRSGKYRGNSKMFEKFITDSVQISHGLQDDPNYITEMYFSEWQEAHPNIPLRNMTHSLFKHFGQQRWINLDEMKIVRVDKTYFSRLSQFLNPYADDIIEDYVHLNNIFKTYGLIDKEFEMNLFIPHKGYTCMPGALVGTAYFYMENYFKPATKIQLEYVYEEIKKMITKELTNRTMTDHFSTATRRKTKNFLNKLEAADVIFAYPDWLSEKSIVERFYTDRYDTSNSGFMQSIHAMKLALAHNLKAFLSSNKEQLIDINVIIKSFMSDKIDFSPDLKQIILPASLFRERNYKFLSELLYPEINFGAAGTLIASEIYSQWLKEINELEFLGCTKKQMMEDNQPEREMYESYKLTAYLLGLRTAFKVWSELDKNLLSIDFEKVGSISTHQVFFLSFAESMCHTKPSTTDIPNLRYLVNFAISNNQDFANAYGCRNDRQMNRTEKCNPLDLKKRHLNLKNHY